MTPKIQELLKDPQETTMFLRQVRLAKVVEAYAT